MYNKDRCHPRLLCSNVNARAPGEFDLCYPKHPGAYLKTCYDAFRGRRGFKNFCKNVLCHFVSLKSLALFLEGGHEALLGAV